MLRFFIFITFCSLQNAYSMKFAVNDISGMSLSSVKDVIVLKNNDSIEELEKIIAKKNPATKLIVRGSQHSQGGHSIAQDGLIIDLSNWKKIEFINPNCIRVQAGARWQEVLEVINKHKKSIAVMQTNFDCSVGGALSANIHGIEVNSGPFIQSVQGFHIVTAEGKTRYCSRLINSDLFYASIGGYGLLGIIVSVDIKLVNNIMYHPRSTKLHYKQFFQFFQDEIIKPIQQKETLMFFARPRLDNKKFMEDIVTVIYQQTNSSPVEGKLAIHKAYEAVAGFVFKRTMTSDLFRQLRWKIESSAFYTSLKKDCSKNQLLYHSMDAYRNKDERLCDLVQEYFIPEEHFEEFYQFIQSQKTDLIGRLMNITISHVAQDKETILPYSNSPSFSFSMHFRGPKTQEFDATIGEIARKLIRKSSELGGSYFLAYRANATKDQFFETYPQIDKFINIKNTYDPDEAFYNKFYHDYVK